MMQASRFSPSTQFLDSIMREAGDEPLSLKCQRSISKAAAALHSCKRVFSREMGARKCINAAVGNKIVADAEVERASQFFSEVMASQGSKDEDDDYYRVRAANPASPDRAPILALSLPANPPAASSQADTLIFGHPWGASGSGSEVADHDAMPPSDSASSLGTT